MDFTIRFNPNNPVWQQWEYIYTVTEKVLRKKFDNKTYRWVPDENDFYMKKTPKRLIGDSKNSLKERVLSRGLEWDESEIEYMSKEKKIIPTKKKSTSSHGSIGYGNSSSKPHINRITSWKKSHYKY